MKTISQDRLVEALESCLRPLVRMLLRSGITYKQFARIAKVAFVQAALKEHATKGRTTNLSRVAVRTDLSRKEVSRLQRQISESSGAMKSVEAGEYHTGHAARVLQLWHTDPRFIDSRNKPRKLSFLGEVPSFATLVRAAGGDVPPGAVRAELSAADAIHEFPDGMLQATKRYYVPADVGEDLLVGLTHIVMPVLVGLDRNTKDGQLFPFIQRFAYSDHLTSHSLLQFRNAARERAAVFLQDVDDWFSAHETTSDHAQGDCGRVGLGVFYFEADQPSDLK